MRPQNLNSFPTSHQRFNSLHSFEPYQQTDFDNFQNYNSERYQDPDSVLKPSSSYNPNISNENNMNRQISNPSVDEFKGMLAKELRSHFEMLRGELMENFSTTIRQYKNSYKINTEYIFP